MSEEFALSFKIDKARSDGSYVRGWAYVVEKDGKATVDHSGDTATLATVAKAMQDFMLDARVAKAMHRGEQMGDIVEMVIVDDEFAKAMGATTGLRGAWIGMRINDEQVRKDVKSGKLRMFSIGGNGQRKRIEQ